MSAKGKKPSSKLSPQERVAIVLSDASSRELGEKYGVCHSRICDIRNEAIKILEQAWEQRRPGRKAKPSPNQEFEAVVQDQEKLTHENESLKMRNEWLEMMVKLEKERTREAARGGKVVKKKRSRRQNK